MHSYYRLPANSEISAPRETIWPRMKCRTVTVPPSSSSPFYVQALQYTPEPEYSRDDGLTLLLFHAMNLHKETFHGLVARVLEDKAINSEGGVKIKDIWCIGKPQRLHRKQNIKYQYLDNPNHGLSAFLNANLLGSDEWEDKCKCGIFYATDGHYGALSSCMQGGQLNIPVPHTPSSLPPRTVSTFASGI